MLYNSKDLNINILNMSEDKKTFFQSIPPKFAFLAGIIGTVAVFSLIGFIITLVLVFGDENKNNNDSVTNKAAVNSANTNSAANNLITKVDLNKLRYVYGTGDITVIEYSDTECPYCKRFHETMLQIIEQYDGKVRWAYKHKPLQSLHRKALKEAIAIECAGEQGKFWEYNNKVFETTNSNDSLPDAELYNIASNLGLDRTKFDDCVNNSKTKSIVSEDTAEAESLGGSGTPFPVIIDSKGNVLEIIKGAQPYESVAATLDKYL